MHDSQVDSESATAIIRAVAKDVQCCSARSGESGTRSGGRMTFDEKIQWFAHNDDDAEDFGDPGGYNESLDNEYEEEEEEESVGGAAEERPAMSGGGMAGGMNEAPRTIGGGGGSSRPARKPAKKKAAKKAAKKKSVKKK